MKATLKVDHLKCGGCSSSIKSGLWTIKNINTVKVNVTQGTVEVDYEGEETLAAIRNKLKDMGYPESGSVSGLEKITTGAKSYVSCAIGKLSKEGEQ